MTRAVTVLTYWLAAVWMAQAGASSIPEYRPGDVAGTDVVAPFEFAVVNPDQTDRLRQQELEKVPAIYRFNPWIAVQAEEQLSLVFSKTRAAFVEAMETAARKRPLDEATIAHPSFWRFVEWFKAQHPDFPLSTNLAKTWALGEPDDALHFQLQSALRNIIGRYVRSDTVPVLADTPEAQVATVDRPNARLTLADLVGKTEVVARPAILTLTEAREELNRRAAEQGEGIGKFLATFLKENLFFDDWLTTQKRQQRAAELVVFDQYSPGQLVVRNGQVVDAKAKAALDVLVTALQRQKNRAAAPKADGWRARLSTWRGNLLHAVRQYPWTLVILAGFIGIILWRISAARRPAYSSPTCEAYTVVMNPARNETVFLPLTTSAPASFGREALTLVDARGTSTQWQMQLREAEQRAEELLALVRAGLAPHLAKELTHKLVQELVSQRASLLRAHQLAEQEILALEARFEKIYRDLQQRADAYEKRTADLEQELVAKAEETRELMKATILLTQQKLEQKKSGDEFACN
jgi:hypothetical protein